MLTSYMTISHDQYQEIDHYRAYPDPPVSPALICLWSVCVRVGGWVGGGQSVWLTTDPDVCSHYHDQDTGLLLSLLRLASGALPSLTPGNHYSALHLYNFAILRILYNWNHAACDPLKSASFSRTPSDSVLSFLAYLFHICCMPQHRDRVSQTLTKE